MILQCSVRLILEMSHASVVEQIVLNVFGKFKYKLRFLAKTLVNRLTGMLILLTTDHPLSQYQVHWTSYVYDKIKCNVLSSFPSLHWYLRTMFGVPPYWNHTGFLQLHQFLNTYNTVRNTLTSANCIYIHTYICMCVCVCVRIYMCVYIYSHTHTHTHIYICKIGTKLRSLKNFTSWPLVLGTHYIRREDQAGWVLLSRGKNPCAYRESRTTWKLRICRWTIRR
jgi:hypothetical protein